MSKQYAFVFVNLSRYKAKIHTVSPAKNRHCFEQEASCFIGVSLENKNFEPVRFCAILEWVVRRYSTFHILVGDSIHRITLELRDNLTQPLAQQQALALGQQFINLHHTAVQDYCTDAQCQFITCDAIQKTQVYQQHFDAIRTYFECNPAFKQSVAHFSERYHRSKWVSMDTAHRAYCVRRSCDYFIEEFAVFACLVEQGYKVMVYPGSFSTLTEIAQGLFPGVSKALEQLTVVSLNLKKR